VTPTLRAMRLIGSPMAAASTMARYFLPGIRSPVALPAIWF